MPAASPETFTETVSVEGVEPLVGETDNQFPPELVAADAAKFTFGPVAVRVNCWFAGLEPPACALKVSGDGAGMVVTLKVTFTVRGLFVAPEAVSVIVPVFTPAVALVGSACTEMTVEPVVPLVGLTDSQPPVLDADTVNGTAEVGLVVTFRFWFAGAELLTEVNVNELGDGTIVKDADVTVRLTVIDCGELEAEVYTLIVPV